LITQSVKEAEGRLAAASMWSGVGYEHVVSFNRRFVMRDGTIGWNPGKLNPNILRPAAEVDPEIKIVTIHDTRAGGVLATYVNFALHPDTVGGQDISADYPYTLAKILSKVKGESMVTVFANGACGDVNHIDVHLKDPQKGHAEAERIGTILAGEVIKNYVRLRPVRDGALRAKSETVKLPLAPIKEGEVEEARRTSLKSDAKFLEKVHAFKVLDVAQRGGRPIEAEVQVIALGNDLAWVGLPGEIFTELGMEIKKSSPFRQTIVAELANGSIGYVPTKRAYGEGNYEVISARCAEGSGEMLVEVALRLLDGVKGRGE
jgi:neutral ceramidase